MPGIDITQTCAATGRQVSTATTSAHPILLVMELMARLQVGHLPNPIFEPHRIWHRSNRACESTARDVTWNRRNRSAKNCWSSVRALGGVGLVAYSRSGTDCGQVRPAPC